MKKLFVLFLLVALVPFTIGCGLFGDNDDTSPVNLPILTASIPSMKVPTNLRAVAVENFKNKVTITINGIELSPASITDIGGGNYRVNFQGLATDINRYNEVVNGNKDIVVTVTTVTSAGTITSSVLITPPAIAAGNELLIPLTAGNMVIPTAIEVVTATTKATVVTVPAVTLPEGQTTVTPLAYTVTNNGVALSETSAGALAVNAAAPAFVVTLLDNKTLNVDNVAFNIMVKNVNGLPAVALTEANFDKGQLTGSQNTITLTTIESASKNLKAGEVYEVNVISVADGVSKLAAKKFYFKAI